MKAERRHELKQNALDMVISGAPDYGRKYGGMAMLVVLAVLAGYLLIRYRVSAAHEAQRVAGENLAAARTSINQLSQLDLFPIPAPQKAEFRKRWSDDARSAIDQVSGSSNDPKLLAESLVAKGDLNWALAQLDDSTAASTQPSTQSAFQQPTDRKALLGEAESSYDQVLTQYGDQKDAALAANFGLAAVYENLGDWDKAKRKYQQIIDDSSVAEAYKMQAKIRLEKAADWSQPVLLAPATQPATPPTPLLPPTTEPTAAPTSRPAATARPTTAPAVER
jgi:tetratricopeptide (TPR) repeat protein